MDSGQELLFEAEDIAPGLNALTFAIAGTRGPSHVIQDGMGNLVDGGQQHRAKTVDAVRLPTVR